MKPMISCIVSSYNTDPKMLEEAINSVLEQSYRDFELILIDDCSTNEESRKLIEKYEKKDERIIALYNERNIGLAASLNNGLNIARGKYIARFDADDICMLNRFEIQVRYMEENPDIDLCSTFMELIGEKQGCVTSIFYDCKSVAAQLLFSCYIPHNTIMFRKDFFDVNDLRYDSKYEKTEDFDLWTRCIEKGAEIATIPQVLVKYRIHLQSVCHTQKSAQQILAQQICCRQLKNIGLMLSPEDISLHMILCTSNGLNCKNYPDLKKWCRKLIETNNTVRYYDKKVFFEVVYNRLFIAVLKADIKRRTKLKIIFLNRNLFCCKNIYSITYKKIYPILHKMKRHRGLNNV